MEQAVVVVMGVAGSGKTTVGQLLAGQLNLPFHDADDFHSPANVAKMGAGIALTDADRQSWLTQLAAGIGAWEQTGGAVLACSALKEAYRRQLQAGARQPLHWVFLDGSRELLHRRLLARQGHYMGPALLDSQLATLEKPSYGVRIQLAEQQTPQAVVAEIVRTYSQATSS